MVIVENVFVRFVKGFLSQKGQKQLQKKYFSLDDPKLPSVPLVPDRDQEGNSSGMNRVHVGKVQKPEGLSAEKVPVIFRGQPHHPPEHE
jgi:hypothetical protein